MMRVATIAIAVSICCVPPATAAQGTSSVGAARFDVASVKPSGAGDEGTRYAVRPDGVTFSNVTLRELIGLAYEVSQTAQRWKFVSGPEGLLSARFTINARVAERATPAEVRVMLRSLLADRFGLRLRREMRDIPVYALTRLRPDRLGKDLRPSAALDCVHTSMSVDGLAALSGTRQSRCSRSMRVDADGAVNKVEAGPIAVLINSLEDVVISRPIVDATGLEGWFEWKLRYQMLLPENPDAPPAPSVLDAVPQQLGLSLEQRTAPVEVFVIERVESPTPD